MVEKTLQELKELSYFHAKRLALNLGLLEGRSTYCRFIILGKGRVGSNLLRGLLNSHSQVIAFGELFRDYEAIGWDLPNYERYARSASLLSLMQQEPIRFLEEEVFKKYPEPVSAVGFKLFYYHAQDDSRQSIWPFLQAQKTIKIIHLKRYNTLRELFSLRKAFKTNQWTNLTGVNEEKVAIYLDYEDCLREFTYAQQVKQQYDRFFKRHPMIDITYEDLSSDYDREMQRIQKFLGVNYELVQPSTYKQSTQPLSEAIVNYAELKQQFSHTPWERFFEE